MTKEISWQTFLYGVISILSAIISNFLTIPEFIVSPAFLFVCIIIFIIGLFTGALGIWGKQKKTKLSKILSIIGFIANLIVPIKLMLFLIFILIAQFLFYG